MSLQRQILFWTLALLAFILVLYLLRPILLPFVAGMALAYALDPIADRFQRLGAGRLTATILILILFTLVFVLLLLAVLPVLWQQILQFAERLPEYVARLNQLIRDGLPDIEWLNEFVGIGGEGAAMEGPLGDYVGTLAGWAAQLAQSLVTGGLAVVNLIALLVVTPVVAFYLLYDWDRMVASIDNWVPREHVATVRELARQIDAALAGFVRGQGLVCIILGVFYGVGLSLLGLNFGLLIGLGAGLISFIPYVGSIIGFVLAMSVAVAQFWPDWLMIAAVAFVFFAGQFVEGNFLQPKLVGGRVRLHPVWLIFALFAFGYLFGFVGLLIAVPVAAAIGVVARFALSQYLASAIYRGGSKPGGDLE